MDPNPKTSTVISPSPQPVSKCWTNIGLAFALVIILSLIIMYLLDSVTLKWMNENSVEKFKETVEIFGRPSYVVNSKKDIMEGIAVWGTGKLRKHTHEGKQCRLIEVAVKDCIYPDTISEHNVIYYSMLMEIPDNKLMSVLTLSKNYSYDPIRKVLVVSGSSNILNIVLLVTAAELTYGELKAGKAELLDLISKRVEFAKEKPENENALHTKLIELMEKYTPKNLYEVKLDGLAAYSAYGTETSGWTSLFGILSGEKPAKAPEVAKKESFCVNATIDNSNVVEYLSNKERTCGGRSRERYLAERLENAAVSAGTLTPEMVNSANSLNPPPAPAAVQVAQSMMVVESVPIELKPASNASAIDIIGNAENSGINQVELSDMTTRIRKPEPAPKIVSNGSKNKGNMKVRQQEVYIRPAENINRSELELSEMSYYRGDGINCERKPADKELKNFQVLEQFGSTRCSETLSGASIQRALDKMAIMNNMSCVDGANTYL